MKLLILIILVSISAVYASGQSTEKVLATAADREFTTADLPEGTSSEFAGFPAHLGEMRRHLLDKQIGELLVEIEALARGVAVEKLLETEVTNKVPAPREDQIIQIFEANRLTIGPKSLDEMRPQIVEFLRREPEQKVYLVFLESLKTKHRVVTGKDVNATGLRTTDILASVGMKQISAADFTSRNGATLADVEGEFYDRLLDEVEQTVFSFLVLKEAKSLELQPGELLAREITDKMLEFSDAERERLEIGFQSKLFKKYDAKILVAEPKPYIQQISTDDDPSEGPANAPVTVVMFSDFQCPACASVHPVLKQVIAEFGNKVRFVVRDFPLVNLHQNAFRAAQAANAAIAQGKFGAFSELLYKNQDNLDIASLRRYAHALGLNIEQFDLDLNNEKNAQEIRTDMADGTRYGVTGTPTIFVNGVKVRKLSARSFRKAIQQSLNQ